MLHTLFIVFSLAHVSNSLRCSNKAQIRLVGGSRNGEGRLEVLGSSGNWSSVCPDNWLSRNGGIACQELCGDRKHASSIPALGRFGPISKPIGIFDTKCLGYEDSLLSCPHVDQNSRSCFEDTAVGLCCHSGCDGRNLFLAPRLRYFATCEWANYTVTVQYPGPNPDGRVRPFYLQPHNNPTCLDQRTGANSTHNWLTVSYKGDCGVILDPSDKVYIQYKQKVLIKGQSTGPSISRYFQFLMPITCGVKRGTSQTLWMDTSPPNGTIDNLPGGYGNMSIDMVIKVFKDANFTRQLATPVILPVGTALYVQLSVDNKKLQAGGRSKILVENCLAIPYLGASNPNIQHTVIQNQLADDAGTDILKSPVLNEVRFKMETFKISDHKELYMSCDAYVCPESDNSLRCKGPAANAQHEPSATEFDASEADANAKSNGKSLNVVSPGFEVPQLRFKPSPIYTNEDLPGLGPDDEVRIARHDNKCYHKFASNGLVRLYHKPKPNSSAVANENSADNLSEEMFDANPCLSQ